MKNIWKILYVGTVCLVFGLIVFLSSQKTQSQYADLHSDSEIEYLEGKIGKIENGNFYVWLKPTQTRAMEEISFQPDPDFLFNNYKVGDIVTLYKIQDESGVVIYDVVDYVHEEGLVYLFLFFLLITVWIAKQKGFFSVLSLVLSTSLFYFIFLNALQVGYNPITACLLFVISMTILTIPLVHGFNRKSASSLLAINLGFALSLFLSWSLKSLVKLGDMPSETLRNLMVQLPDFDVGSLLLVILFLGAVGALIDTAVTVSSAVFESQKTAEQFDFKKSFELGMEVGKDILGSMINTLLLAYLAASIPFFILLTYAKSTSLSDLLNFDFVALEITRTLIGAISLVVLVPVTAVIASWMLGQKKCHPKLPACR